MAHLKWLGYSGAVVAQKSVFEVECTALVTKRIHTHSAMAAQPSMNSGFQMFSEADHLMKLAASGRKIEMTINQSDVVLTLLDSMISERDNKKSLAARLLQPDIPEGALLDNLANSLALQSLSRINYIQSLNQKIVPVYGAIMGFGVLWGQTMALFSQMPGMLKQVFRKALGISRYAMLSDFSNPLTFS